MRDPVTNDVALFVLARDAGCVAPRLGGTVHDCAGRNRLEHVKHFPRMARRAPSCPCALVTLCDGHTEPGMKAGYVWCTDRENRAACRALLATFGYGPHVPDHAALILAAHVIVDRIGLSVQSIPFDCGHVDPVFDCDACQRRVPA